MPNVTVYVMTTWQNLPTKSSPIDATNLNHIEQGIQTITNWINTLNVEAGKVMGSAAFTTALKTKLDGIEAQANKYILPIATNTVLGGVKIDNRTIIIDANGVISGRGEISTLLDVTLTDLADGETLVWDATAEKWVNTTLRTELALLEDVDIDDQTLEDGQVLKYNETAGKWENGESGEVLDYDETIDVLGLPPNPIYRWRALIPAMTGATTPSGAASASSQFTSSYPYYAWKAVDGYPGGLYDHRWSGAQNAQACWWQYKFDSPKTVEKMVVNFGEVGGTNVTYKDADITIQVSDDGTTFTDLLTYTITVDKYQKPLEIMLSNPAPHEYYRIQFADYIFSTAYKYCGINELQMYERYLA